MYTFYLNHIIKRLLFRRIIGCIFCLGFAIPVSAQDSAQTDKVQLQLPAKRVLYGAASFYSDKFNGRKTASGEIFNQLKLTCASNEVPIGTWIKVTNIRNGKSVIVKVNDRIHPKVRRVVDLTSAAASRLGFLRSGLTRVKVEVLGRNQPKSDELQSSE